MMKTRGSNRRLKRMAKNGENRAVEWLELIRKNMRLYILQGFVGFKRRGGEQGGDDAMHGSVVWLARQHAWIATFVERLIERDTRGRHCHNLCADTDGRVFKLEMEQLIINVR